MTDNPFAKYAQPAAPAAPQQSSFPGVIPGRPKQPDPVEAERLRLAQEAADRAGRAEERANRTEARQAQADALGTESERTAGFLAGRLKDAAIRLAGTAKQSPDAQRPTLGVEAVRGVFGDTAANYLTDGDRQQVRAAQIDIIDAGLTLGTGAAYTKEQLEGYREVYFPKLGDDEATIASKREALRSLLTNAQTKAGRAAPDIEAALAALDALNSPAPTGANEAGDEEEGLSGSVTYEGPNPANDPTNLGPDGKPRVTGNDPGYAQFAGGVGNIVEGGVNNTIGLLATPLNNTINAAFGTNLETNLGASLRQAMGLPYLDETTDAVQQAVSGGINMAGAASKLGARVAGNVGNALTAYGSRPVVDAVTGGTAAFSGEIARQAGAGPVGQAAAIVAGGAAPNALMGFARSAGRAPADLDRNVIAAGQRQGVPVRQPDAIPSKRGEMANIETTQRGGPIIQQARQSDNALIEQRTGNVAGEGSPLEPYPMGQKVQGAGKRFIERTRTQAGRLYARAQKLSGEQRIVPQKAIDAVDAQIAELKAAGESSNGALIAHFEGLKKDLSKAGGFSIEEFQGLRSAQRNKIKGDNALTASDADRRLGIVVKEFSADATDQLPDAASNALDAADSFYAQRQEFIGNVLKQVMGTRGNPLPAERAAERLMAMTKGKGDYDRFSRMWAELDPDEQADTAATIAQSLGRKANGDFSPATLVRSLDPAKGLNPRTARLIFGEDGARALQDLRTLAAAKTDTASALNNSRTGNMVNRAAGGLKTLILSGLGFSAGGVGGAVAAPMAMGLVSNWGQERAARALLNPDFTRMLKQMPEATNPKAIDGYFKRMTVQAAKSPILANDVRGFQDALRSSFANDNVNLGRAVASDEQGQDEQ